MGRKQKLAGLRTEASGWIWRTWSTWRTPPRRIPSTADLVERQKIFSQHRVDER